MHSLYQQLFTQRYATNKFACGQPLSTSQIELLIDIASRAPSAFHQQNWRFIAVTSDAGKRQLQQHCFGQSQLVDAAVSFIVIGDSLGYQHLQQALQPAVDAGQLSPQVQQSWVAMAQGMYQDNPQYRHFEAVRSASMAAMNLMLAATAAQLACCPVGFDADGLRQDFALAVHEVPVMVVAVGHQATQQRQQKQRKALTEVLAYA